ncbi:hypothetical protein [Effusibacillus consociatus]|uniref:Outer membrane lipoprotein-sorting protein n=1 Tax=Effusibacillus consociatus TaxID=1117041 RepID=A0ABV9Q1Q8_9BACL
MATLLKYSSILGIWVGLFYLSFTMFSSRDEEDLLRIQKALTSSQAWRSYSSTQTVEFDNKEELRIRSISQQDPYSVWVTSKAKLTDTEDFQFEVYFQPEVIYVHTLNSNTWNKTDYTSSVAGELQGLKDPFSFWLRLLKSAHTIEKREDGNRGSYFSVKLKPFRDEVHGIRFEDVETAVMHVWTRNEPVGIQKMELNMRLKPNIIRRYDQITYRIQFSDINQSKGITLPQEAKSAQKINK